MNQQNEDDPKGPHLLVFLFKLSYNYCGDVGPFVFRCVLRRV